MGRVRFEDPHDARAKRRKTKRRYSKSCIVTNPHRRRTRCDEFARFCPPGRTCKQPCLRLSALFLRKPAACGYGVPCGTDFAFGGGLIAKVVVGPGGSVA